LLLKKNFLIFDPAYTVHVSSVRISRPHSGGFGQVRTFFG